MIHPPSFLSLFLADRDTDEGVRARAARRGPDSGVQHAWRVTGAAPAEVHFPPALEKPDEWIDTGRGHSEGRKHLSCFKYLEGASSRSSSPKH